MVNPGYKQTELGLLPEAWACREIGSFADVCMCKRIFAEQTSEMGEIPFYKIGTFGKKADAYISRLLFEEYKQKYSYPQKGDVLISAAGTLGRTVVYDGEEAYFQDSNIVWLDIDKSQISNNYLYHYYKVIKWTPSEGSTIARLYNGIITSTNVAVPPKPEQEAIAKALSDIDTLIVNLEKLIVKKKAIKQGAMQELLTGKCRLPGFDSEWKTVQIGTFTSVFSGGTPSTANPLYWGGNIPWMSSGELNMKIVREVRGRITATGMENSSTRMIPAFCVLIGLAGQGKTRGTAAFNMFPLCTNQSIAAIFPNESQFDSKFLYFYMDTQYTELRELSAGGGGRGGLTKKLIEDFYVTIPSDIKEQASIAEILTDIDDEIEHLEKELYKTMAIKQGMMSELLTGRIRLIDKEDV